MRRARLLFVVLLMCASAGLTQDHQGHVYTGPIIPPIRLPILDITPAASSSEPWNVIPIQPQNTDPTQTLAVRVDRYKIDYSQMDKYGRIFPPYRIWTGGDLLIERANHDSVCYAIRSYVVARDDKNSDSTHPVRSSTCQPARRYGLKNVQVRPGSSDR